jgi:hypothetical protein
MNTIYEKLVQILRSAEASDIPKEKNIAEAWFHGFIISRRKDETDTLYDIPMFTAEELREGAEIARRENIVAADLDLSFESCLIYLDRAQAAAMFLRALMGETIHFDGAFSLNKVVRSVHSALKYCLMNGYTVPNLYKSGNLARLLVDTGFITKDDDGFSLNWRDANR